VPDVPLKVGAVKTNGKLEDRAPAREVLHDLHLGLVDEGRVALQDRPGAASPCRTGDDALHSFGLSREPERKHQRAFAGSHSHFAERRFYVSGNDDGHDLLLQAKV
jgi:hypothetical protein